VFVRRSDNKLYPCLYEDKSGNFLKYGHRYPLESICADAKLSHSDRSHLPVSSSKKAANIFVLTQKYKQSPPKMNALLEALDIFNSKGSGIVKQMECNFGQYDGHIVIMGSGGSHKILGNFAPTTKSSKNE
jgi:hypothetical protein